MFSAYLKYAKTNGFTSELLGTADGHFSACIRGTGVWQVFSSEIGKHCVQRVPPTEKRGRRQTTYLTVGVLPVPSDVRSMLPESELAVTTQGGHGKGGQHQNKRDSAVRMRHVPTGLTVFINGRDQHANRREALRILTAKVNDYKQSQADAQYAVARKAQLGDAGRGGKIRTYNFIDCRAVDHRSGRKTPHVRRVIERGEFELLK